MKIAIRILIGVLVVGAVTFAHTSVSRADVASLQKCLLACDEEQTYCSNHTGGASKCLDAQRDCHNACYRHNSSN